AQPAPEKRPVHAHHLLLAPVGLAAPDPHVDVAAALFRFLLGGIEDPRRAAQHLVGAVAENFFEPAVAVDERAVLDERDAGGRRLEHRVALLAWNIECARRTAPVWAG